jgi:hypothetical protein
LNRLRSIPRIGKGREIRFNDRPQTYSPHSVEPKDGITRFHLHIEDVEAQGYDLHQACDGEITDTYHWKVKDGIQRPEWEAGDCIYLPVCPHFNAAPERLVQLIVAVNRI